MIVIMMGQARSIFDIPNLGDGMSALCLIVIGTGSEPGFRNPFLKICRLCKILGRLIFHFFLRLQP